MLMIVYVFLIVVCFEDSFGYIEIVEEEGNESRMFMLTCRHLHSKIAILEGKFYPDNVTIYENSTYPFEPENPRIALNKRCSGVNHCSFELKEDCPGANRWGTGHFYIKYACVSDRNVHQYCNREIKLETHQYQGISGGFIHNPGYPRFYLGKHNCHWKLKAPPLQKVRIIILDLAIIGPYNDNKCTDNLEIIDSERVVYKSCDQSEPPKEVVSTGDTLEIKLITNEILIPRRGILIQYTAVGCETPLPPKHGYLVFRNDTTAIFSCCIGYIFPKLRSRILNLNCIGRAWNYQLPLPQCINIIDDNQQHINIISLGKPPTNMENSSVTDVIVVPSLVLVALFVLNAIVVFLILKYRQRKNALYTDEELNPIPYTNDTP